MAPGFDSDPDDESSIASEEADDDEWLYKTPSGTWGPYSMAQLRAFDFAETAEYPITTMWRAREGEGSAVLLCDVFGGA
jgi:hypothetical protein